jgi:hypothetical protein
LAILKADPSGMLFAVNVHLFKNDLTPTINTVLADFSEADFSGYSLVGPIQWGNMFINTAGQGVIVSLTSCQFIATGSTFQDVIYGYYVTQGTAPVLLRFAERFPAPVAISAANDAVVVLPQFTLG